jgi:hypothetical protein
MTFNLPWRLRCQCDANDQERRPHPLQRVRYAIGPLIGPLQHGLDDSNSDQLSQTPAEVHISVRSSVSIGWPYLRDAIRSEISAKRNRAHLRSVGDSKRLEDSPRNACACISTFADFRRLNGHPPHRISAISSSQTCCAVKNIAVKPVMQIRHAMTVYL